MVKPPFAYRSMGEHDVLFTYYRLHVRMLYDLFAALVTVVGIKFLPFVADIKQL